MLDNGNALVTKTFMKRAVIFGTSENKLWREFKKESPEARMVTQSYRKTERTHDMRNVSYKNMELFIRTQNNAKELLEEFGRIKMQSKVQTNPYLSVYAWFVKKFEDYDAYKQFFKERDEENTQSKVMSLEEARKKKEPSTMQQEELSEAING